MKQQQWTVTRCPVSHLAAERRWDHAYQRLLSMPVAALDIPTGDTPAGAFKESHHARSHLRSGIDHAPSPDAND